MSPLGATIARKGAHAAALVFGAWWLVATSPGCERGGGGYLPVDRRGGVLIPVQSAHDADQSITRHANELRGESSEDAVYEDGRARRIGLHEQLIVRLGSRDGGAANREERRERRWSRPATVSSESPTRRACKWCWIRAPSQGPADTTLPSCGALDRSGSRSRRAVSSIFPVERRPICLAALLPDLIDKPLFYIPFWLTGRRGAAAGILSGTHLFAHTGLFLLALVIAALITRSLPGARWPSGSRPTSSSTASVCRWAWGRYALAALRVALPHVSVQKSWPASDDGPEPRHAGR